MLTGYKQRRYAESLEEFGRPLHLPQCGGWILERQIPGSPYRDAMGCYPLFCCQKWQNLHADLEAISKDLVSLAIVTDPFGEYAPSFLNECFQDVMFPFKEYFIVDLSQSMEKFVSAHHRRNVRKALHKVEVEVCQEPAQFINEWMGLYVNLIERHDIKGIPAFSNASLTKQLEVPGRIMFRAVTQDTTVGMLLWYIHKDIGYYHLGAYSPLGYKLLASFALFRYAIEYFSAIGLRWLSLGAGAGIDGGGTEGLNRFKEGWSTHTRTVYFCGRIFNYERYTELLKAKGIATTSYFPAYRKGEFASE